MNSSIYLKKADELKAELKHSKAKPRGLVKFYKDENAFQGIGVEDLCELKLPVELKAGEPVILDFGRHCVGYLGYALDTFGGKIVDSPVALELSFGELPLEIESDNKNCSGTLGNGWIQKEYKKTVFVPSAVMLDSRYAFRYVKLTRVDNGKASVYLRDIFADCVSAVDLKDANEIHIPDAELRRIYDISLNTLKECEQEVFEDGPKRDRRLWLGDLRLQALADYASFNNIALIKRCLYLFAAHKGEDNTVASCIFPDSPPYRGGFLADYALYFVSCLYDYVKNTGDLQFAEELFEVAKEQIDALCKFYKTKNILFTDYFFVDWCPGLKKEVSQMGILIYALKQFNELSELLCKNVRIETKEYEDALLSFYSHETGLFVAEDGQISWHSQIWAVLSGVLTEDEGGCILESIKKSDTELTMRTPYMIHYYIEALHKVGKSHEAMEYIKNYWGKISDCGFDCCPEVFNPENHMESPYGAPEINSACHAWSCTPVYWIYKYYCKGENV